MTKNRTPTPVYLDPGMHSGLEVKGLKRIVCCVIGYDYELIIISSRTVWGTSWRTWMVHVAYKTRLHNKRSRHELEFD